MYFFAIPIFSVTARYAAPLVLLTALIGCQQQSAPNSATSETASALSEDSTQSRTATDTSEQPPEQEAQASDTPSDSAASQAAAGTPQTDQPVQPIWTSWPKPQLALMLTTEMHGYVEPCGCTENQLGGMSRRADLHRKLRDAGWEVRGLDAGGLVRRRSLQAQIKFEFIQKMLGLLDYVALGLGPEELRLDPDFLLSMHTADETSGISFLSANLVFYDAPDLGTPVAHRIVEAGGLRLGVTSVISKTLVSEVLPSDVISWKDPAAVLPGVLKTFDAADVDVRILLSQATPEESVAFAEQFPQFDIVLSAEGVADPDPNKPPRQVGTTLVISAGRKGKYVGMLGIYPEDSEERFRYQLVSLTRDAFDDSPQMIALFSDYQDRLRADQVVLKDGVHLEHPSGAKFVGVARCAECHTAAHAVWKDTPHAHALESLDPANRRKGSERLHGVVRIYDPECLACHVTGWDPTSYVRYSTGFLNEEFATSDEEKTLHRLMANNQCENCHGPGSRHIELIESGENEQARAPVRVTLEESKKSQCGICHDPDNSPKFDFDSYWQDVAHKGLD